MPDWDTIFSLSTSPLEVIVRGTVTFVALMLLLRLAGQRESGGLGITDLLVVVLVADAASAGLVGDATSIADGLLLVGVLLFWSVAVDAFAYRWPRFAKMVKARPKLLIEDGRLNRHLMRREFMTHEEVLSQLRLQGIQDPANVRRAYLEPNGMVSVIPREGAETTGPPIPARGVTPPAGMGAAVRELGVAVSGAVSDTGRGAGGPHEHGFRHSAPSLRLNDEVSQALGDGAPVVALERHDHQRGCGGDGGQAL